MARFLFVSWNGGGNLPPMFEIALRLRRRGHRVDFCGTELDDRPHYATLAKRCRDRGYRFERLERSSERFRADGRRGILTGVFACAEHGAELQEVTTSGGYDAIVMDGLMFGALAAAEAAGLPGAVVVPGAPGAFAEPGAPMEQMLLPAVNGVRADLGLSTLPRLLDAWGTLPTMCESVRELDPCADEMPQSMRYLGPVFETAEPSGWTLPWPQDDERPLVLVSFTTNPAWDQTSRIERTIEALGDGPYRVLVTSSLADTDALDVPGNVAVIKQVPHAEVLPHAAVMVGHAGHGTIAMPLAHGVPVVSLPNPVADQPALAHQVASLGAGIALDGESASVSEIADAVAAVVGDPTYADAAASLAATMASTDSAEASADWLESTLETGGTET